MRDHLKRTIIDKISKVVEIEVKDNLIENKTKAITYPKLIFKEYSTDGGIKVIDFEKYDMYGIEEAPILDNVVGLYVCDNDTNNKSLIKGYSNGLLILGDNGLGYELVEYMSELTILSSPDDVVTEDSTDYIYVSSLYNLNKRLSYNSKEVFRRFEIGVFIYDDPTQDKCNYYMDTISSVLDRDFKVVDEDGVKVDYAYIYNPIKFDVEENGKTNRVVYGSVMIKTYK